MKGSITVFLSMIMAVVISAAAMSVESARLACTRFYLKQAGAYSLESVMADYYVPLFEDYGLMFLDVTYGGEENVVTEKFEKYLSYNLNPNKGRLVRRSFFYAAEALDILVSDIIYAVECGGDIVKRQIYEYMKYKLPADFVENFLAEYDYIFRAEELRAFFEQIERIEDELRDIDEVVLKLNGLADTVKKYQAELEELYGRIKSGKGLTKEELMSLNELFEAKKKELVGVADNMEESADTYDRLTEKVSEYLTGLSDTWLTDVDVPEFIKDIVREEIEDLLMSVGGVGDMYGIGESRPYIEKLTELLGQADASEQWLNELLDIKLTVNMGEEIADSVLDVSLEMLLEELRQSSGIYSVICPDYSDISEKSINIFYNRSYAEREGGLKLLPGRRMAEAVAERICLAEYAVRMFADYCNPMEDRPAECESEYILGGSLTEKNNVSTTINKLIGVREVLNLLYLMCDAEKKDTAHTLALSVAEAGGGASVKITQYLIMAVWALGEALIDARILMSGGTVPLMKSADDWELELYKITDVFKIVDTKDVTYASSPGEWGYSDYLKLLIFMDDDDEQAFRIMDLIEEDIQNKYYSEFYFDNCAYYIEVKVDYNTGALLSKMAEVLPKISFSYKYSY